MEQNQRFLHLIDITNNKEELKMIKNKAIHAMIIGTCIFASSMTGVYADTTTTLDAPVTVQIQQVNNEDQLTQKQSEIDQYVFEKNAKDFADKGITVTHTGVIGDSVEVGITPFNEDNAKYVYDIFGKDMVNVVEGMQAVPLMMQSTPPEVTMQITSAPVDKETSSFTTFFDNIWEWIVNIF
jgi:hypothetical protein